MRIAVGRRTAIGENDDAVADVSRIPHGVLNRELRRESHHVQAIDIAIFQKSFEIRATERTVAGVDHDVLVRERVKADPDSAERVFTEPIRRVLQRGIDEGVLDGDVPVDIQLALFGGALHAGVRLVGERRLGLEDAAAAVTRAYLDGARGRTGS